MPLHQTKFDPFRGLLIAERKQIVKTLPKNIKDNPPEKEVRVKVKVKL